MIDVEIKARCEHQDFVRKKLKELGAQFAGIDNQVDVYFQSINGRLKLRKGDIEGALVFYERDDIKGIKPSEFKLYHSNNPEVLEEILHKALGVMVVVKKRREMYFINNVKFNIDNVEGLGKFIEIEAMTENHSEIEKLKSIVKEYLELLRIDDTDLESHSYSDLLTNNSNRVADS